MNMTAHLIDRMTRISGRSGVRYACAVIEAWVSIIGNTVLAVLKVIVALHVGSIALLADAAHTASDVVTSVVVLIGFRLANASPDSEHPYGHGRAEYVATLVIAMLLALTGLKFGEASAQRLMSHEAAETSVPLAALILATAAAKEWMARYAVWLGRRISSDALIADAWHHRSDAFASALVAVSMVVSTGPVWWLDAVGGIFVSALIIWTGLAIARGAANSLIGVRAPDELLDAISRKGMEIAHVKDVHSINVHDYGGVRFATAHVVVDGLLPVAHAHAVAEQVTEACSSLDVAALIHVEPDTDPAE